MLLLAAVLFLPPEPTLESYLSLIRRWSRGDDAAVAVLLDWSPKHASDLASKLRAGKALYGDDCLRAAALLHTEAGFLEMDRGRKQEQERHFETARRQMEAVSKTDDFVRRWRLAIAYRLQEWFLLPEALQEIEGVLDAWGEDPEAMVAVGSLYELLDAFPKRNWMRMNLAASRRRELEEAAQHYRRALAKQSAFHEARLRWGRVLQRLGETKEARRELATVLESHPDAEIEALAHLFLGDIDEGDGALDEAVAHYRRAVAADPYLLPALLSLSHALRRTGQPDAVVALQAGLQASADLGRVDSWVGYHTSLLHGYRPTIDRLRGTLRP